MSTLQKNLVLAVRKAQPELQAAASRFHAAFAAADQDLDEQAMIWQKAFSDEVAQVPGSDDPERIKQAFRECSSRNNQRWLAAQRVYTESVVRATEDFLSERKKLFPDQDAPLRAAVSTFRESILAAFEQRIREQDSIDDATFAPGVHVINGCVDAQIFDYQIPGYDAAAEKMAESIQRAAQIYNQARLQATENDPFFVTLINGSAN